MRKQPQYLVRPDDYCLFELNFNGTYSAKLDEKTKSFHQHEEDTLRGLGFFAADPKLFNYYEEQRNAYYKKMSEMCRKNRGCGD